MPFLEVLTRTFRRPIMLANNQASLRQQTDQDYTQTLLNDPDGRGIGWSYKNLAGYAPHLVGDYIWLLDDDDMAVSLTLVADLKEIVEAHTPDVIFLKMDHGPLGILPRKLWGQYPEQGDIGCSAFVVKRQIWQRHSRYFGAHYAGDFEFISSMFFCDYKVHWFDCVGSAVQRISHGEAE